MNAIVDSIIAVDIPHKGSVVVGRDSKEQSKFAVTINRVGGVSTVLVRGLDDLTTAMDIALDLGLPYFNEEPRQVH